MANMDRQHLDESEVFQELEKLLIKSTLIINEKISEAQAQDIAKKLDTINKSLETTSKSVGDFINLSKNLAKDESKEITDEDDDKVKEPTEEEQEEAKRKLLEELQDLASKAGYSGNHKIAYKIERAIDRILEE